MTKSQCRKNCKILKKDANKSINMMIEKVLKSGALDLKEYEYDFLLPKLIMSAIYSELAWQYKPNVNGAGEEIENIKRYL